MSPLTREQLQTRIMRRIYAVWFWRRVAPILGVEVLLLTGVAVGVFVNISPRQILLNALSASSGVLDFGMFFVRNFFAKSIQSQLLLAVYAVIMAFFVRDLRSALRRISAGGREPLVAVATSGNQARHI